MTIPLWASEIQAVFVSRTRGAEIQIKTCPYCGNARWNLEVNIQKAVFNCWVCSAGGNVKWFLKDAGIPFDAEDFKKEYVPVKKENPLQIPEYRPLWGSTSKAGETARNYLIGRGVTPEMLQTWGFGLCTGTDRKDLDYDYRGFFLVPFYGMEGLNYFCAGSYLEKCYRLPPVAKDRFLARQRGSASVMLVEGLFDATAAWRWTDFDVWPLFGTNLMAAQLQMLREVGYSDIYVGLDGDAIPKAISMAQRLLSAGQKVHLVRFPEDADPGELQENMVEYINKAETVTEGTAVLHKIDRVRKYLL